MNILDREYRHVVAEGQFFASYSTMVAEHPELLKKDWIIASVGSWMLDPHTGEAKSEYDWQMDWLEDAYEAWRDLSWTEVKNGILMPVVMDTDDPEGKTFISKDSAMEMMKEADAGLMHLIEQEPCVNASIQDVWEAFWAYQQAKGNATARQSAI